MGWYYILNCKCNVLQEFIPFIKGDYLRNEGESKQYENLMNIWKGLGISHHFYKYSLQGSQFSFQICKKVNRHEGDLREDYETFLKDIIVYITDEITECTIESDDYGNCVWHYTDSQLRNIRFRLPDKIKCVEHVYDKNSDIIETRVFYKHPIKKIQHLDLERSYTREW